MSLFVLLNNVCVFFLCVCIFLIQFCFTFFSLHFACVFFVTTSRSILNAKLLLQYKYCFYLRFSICMVDLIKINCIFCFASTFSRFAKNVSIILINFRILISLKQT